MAATPTMKDATLCSNMMTELGSGPSCTSMPVHIDSTSPLHVVASGHTVGVLSMLPFDY